MEGKSGTINKELDFRSWHCARQGRGKFIKSQILDQSFKNKELDFRPWHCGRQGGEV